MHNVPAVQQNDVAIVDGKLAPSSMIQAQITAGAIFDSGLAPNTLRSPAQVFIAICSGLEIGLSPMQAVQSIAVIQGKPTIYGDSQLGVCMSHPDFEDIEEKIDMGENGMIATCTVKRKNRTACVRTFSVEDAKKAKLWGKPGLWTQYPQRMLQMRARSWALRDSFADALRGIPQMEEISDIPSEPVVVSNTQETQPEYVQQPAQQQPDFQPLTDAHKKEIWDFMLTQWSEEDAKFKTGLLAQTFGKKLLSEVGDLNFQNVMKRIGDQIDKEKAAA